MLEQIQIVGMLIVKGVIVPLIGVALAWASAHLPAWIASKVKNQRIAGILRRITELALAVVQEIEQTVVAKFGDKTDAAALNAARDQALDTLKSHLGPQGLQDIEKVLGLQDQDAVIKLLITFIEQAVHNVNQASNPTVTTEKTGKGLVKTTVTGILKTDLVQETL